MDVHVQFRVRFRVRQGGLGDGCSALISGSGCRYIIFHHIFFIPKLCLQFPENGHGRRAFVIGYKAEFRLSQGFAVPADLFQEQGKISFSSKIRVCEGTAFPHGYLCFIHGQESSRSRILLQNPVFIPVPGAGKTQAVREAAQGSNPVYIFLFFPG